MSVEHKNLEDMPDKKNEVVLHNIIHLQQLEIARLNKLVRELNSNVTELILLGRIGGRRENNDTI